MSSYLAELHAAHLARRARDAAVPFVVDTLVMGDRLRREQRTIDILYAEADARAPPPLALIAITHLRSPPVLAWTAPIRQGPIVDIQRATADAYEGITVYDILGDRMTARITRPRMVAMYLSRKLTHRSYPAIGRAFGGRGHTTAMHAYIKIGRLAREDVALANKLGEITANLGHL